MAFDFPYFKALLAPFAEFSLRLIVSDNTVNDVVSVTKNEESHFLIGISNFETKNWCYYLHR
jgi:hypothetical protein